MQASPINEFEGAISATFVDKLGSDLTVVNSARVTMGIEHEVMSDNDNKLIQFLARQSHITPFRHPSITLKCKAPIAIARQLSKHQVGFNWNEKSRRYKDGTVEIYIPSTLHQRPSDLHSGAGSLFPPDQGNRIRELICHASVGAVQEYVGLLEKGLAPEQARFVLPQNMVTEWVWTGSLYGWFNLYRQRSTEHAQYEARLFAKQIDEIMTVHYPICWNALKEFQ